MISCRIMNYVAWCDPLSVVPLCYRCCCLSIHWFISIAQLEELNKSQGSLQDMVDNMET
jgi:hypothetical protein